VGSAVSEYQYYEFLAIDRPLDERQLAEVRALSTRARITATTFVNEYHWGDFRGDPSRMMQRYYDAHLYLANWGTHRLMFRLPRRLLDPDAVQPYLIDGQVDASIAGEFLVLELTGEDDASDLDYDVEPLLGAIVGVRTELATGDHRPLYLAWLAGYGAWEHDEDAFDRDSDDGLEPTVPPGLASLTAPQRALADFLRLDADLLAVAAHGSPPLVPATDDPDQLATWITSLPPAEKDRLLVRVVEDNAVTVRMEVLRRFRDEHTTRTADPPRRTVADLLDGAARLRTDRERRAAIQRAEEQARREEARALARERRLDTLAKDEEAAWLRVETMIATRKPGEYDRAVTLLTDLLALADRDGRRDEFSRRSTTLRHTHARKPSLIERLDQAGV